MNNYQFFDVEQAVGDERVMRGVHLNNGIKMILISDKNIVQSACSIGVNVGYYSDIHAGTAHFIEHLLFLGSSKYPDKNDYHSYIQMNGGYDNAFTSTDFTCYYLTLESTFFEKGLDMLTWFFKEPLFVQNLVNSEMEIIESEHQKNKASDIWIMDDVFKKFITPDNSKYKKFGTGSIDTLQTITRDEIISFFEKYYIGPNIVVCIVDSIDIEEMIKRFVPMFDDIKNTHLNSTPTRSDNRIEFISDNFIVYESISDYKFLNLHIVMDGDSRDQTDYQLFNFLSFIVGSEYTNSLTYHLLENDLIQELSSSVDYYYDVQSQLSIQIVLNTSIVEEKPDYLIEQILYSVIDFFKHLITINYNDFEYLYDEWKKILMMNLMYQNNSDSQSVSTNVVENMHKGSLQKAIVRRYYVSDCSKKMWEKFIHMIKQFSSMKITSNVNYKGIGKNPNIFPSISEWYNTKYWLSNIDLEKIEYSEKYTLYQWILKNCIGIPGYSIIVLPKNNNLELIKSKRPELIHANGTREIYLLEYNKYMKPICSIGIVRENKEFLEDDVKILLNIYFKLIYKVCNYYVHTMSDYRLEFSIYLSSENVICEFKGPTNAINLFISNTMKIIHPNVVLMGDNAMRYFNEILRDTIESIQNFKYNSPREISQYFMKYLISQGLSLNEKLDFLRKITWDSFKSEIERIFKFTREYYLLVGVGKYGSSADYYNLNEFGLSGENTYNYENDSWMKNLIDLTVLDGKIGDVVSTKNLTEIERVKKTNSTDTSYYVDKSLICPKESNNCIIRYWNIGDVQLEYDEETQHLKLNTFEQIVKIQLITMLVAELFNEPLFDKIRTVDKLGYIVRAYSNVIKLKYTISYNVTFLVQSTFSIKKIGSSIDNFLSDLKSNIEDWKDKYNTLKQSQQLEYSKPFTNLSDEVESYMGAIALKTFNFNTMDMYIRVLEQLDYEQDVLPVIKHVIESKNYVQVIYDKDIV